MGLVVLLTAGACSPAYFETAGVGSRSWLVGALWLVVNLVFDYRCSPTAMQMTRPLLFEIAWPTWRFPLRVLGARLAKA